jgi:chromosome segregation ATPase
MNILKKTGEYAGVILMLLGIGWALGRPATNAYILSVVASERYAKEVVIAGQLESLQKGIVKIDAAAAATSQDVDSLRNEQSVLRTKIDNTERQGERANDKLDRLIERLLPTLAR